MFKQLTFSFKTKNKFDHDLYFCDCNKEAIFWINKWPYWNGNGIIVYGEDGLGKTYLANFWSNVSAAAVLSKNNIHLIGDLMQNPACSVVIEDIDDLFDSNLLLEFDMLHFFNLHKDSGHYIFITCKNINFISKINLPDLSSRLLSLPAVQIQIPDSNILFEILSKKFNSKQILASEQIMRYLSNNIPRSFKAASLIIDWIDNITLSQQSKITLELIKQGINELFSLKE